VTAIDVPEAPSGSSRRETARQFAAFHAYRGAWWAGRALPESLGRRLYRRGGLIAHALMPGVREVVAANQAQILGRPVTDPIVRVSTRDAFASYARYWFDAFHVVGDSDERVRERFHAVDVDNLWAALEHGNGAICSLPHMGNWDVAGRWLAAVGRPCVAVAEGLEPPRLFELFLEHRRALGMDIIGLSNAKVGQQLATRLSENRIVALVADRDLSGRGVPVTMFGRSRTLPAGPALLSITTGAPLLVTPVYQVDDGWRCVFVGPVRVEPSGDRRRDVVALTEAMAREFERAISVAPSDWHVFQPGWPP
jgi:phosphatidylinositol dimannoside acyltransferase